ncbi:PSD1 and planctomycete cytochrome C domain-containing protein [Lignipirellula cremea]|uniref:Planctomycete cytochrome C n=1 Tax=Lignipirellula cremea TaxID=2528010 RepID=A0A518DQC4_9BACT|nr:PSD1 and planctomycete cytochrome C domain-containing protein [Lignipirellula cremea]QDU94014.1 Planctomycete cytochrome C [Lignipirellula cremea]
MLQTSPALAIGLLLLAAVPSSAADKVAFNRDIRPILSDNCFSCHGPDATHREADLRLDQPASAKEHGLSPGNLDESEVWQRLVSEDEDLRMPPPDSGKKLLPEQLALIRQWIEQGAPYETHWAYVPPEKQTPPAVKQTAWPRNTIDEFLLARMEAEGIEPSPEADRVTLLRRLSFDLNGLPPTPAEVKAFLADESEGAYESVVDRLLASPRYGERMAMYWLDLVRFADTVGYHGDQDHNISPYRDYCIDAFNQNVPFDQFTREQLAGDLTDSPGNDQLVASGYNRLLQTSHEGGVQPKEYLAIYAADRVRNVSAVWLGGTLGCAQCHDHKFDPYTARDFYSMAAFFADVDEAKHFRNGGNAIPTRRDPEVKLLGPAEHRRVQQLEKLLQNAAATDAQREAWQAELDALKASARLTMITVAIEPREMRILARGDWLDDSGPVVAPATPAFLPALETGDRRATRLDLANWLTNPDQAGGLTARVFANRFWYLLFGVGLSKNLDDFGGQGEPPVHAELLDYLAVEFYSSGWNVKRLLKQMVMSQAYRQSSVATPAARLRDPYNRLVARQSSFRLPAEMVRDNALAISGLLVLDYGGGSVKPYQPEGYYRHLNFPKRTYSADTDDQQWRRGVYMHWQRQFLHPMLKAFDAPSREECVAERPRSNTPLAALTLLNDPTFVEAARAFAARLLGEDQPANERTISQTDEERLQAAFLQAVSRPPDPAESRLLLELLQQSRQAYQKESAAAKELTAVGQAPVNEQLPASELAAWTTVARALLNLHETMTRN